MGDGGRGRESVGADFVRVRIDKDGLVGMSNGAGFDDNSGSQRLRLEDNGTSTKNVRVCKKDIRESLGDFKRRTCLLLLRIPVQAHIRYGKKGAA